MNLAPEKWVTTSEWIKASDLAKRWSITPTTLHRKRVKLTRDGTWIKGRHWIKSGEVNNSIILFNAQECFKTFSANRAPSKGVESNG